MSATDRHLAEQLFHDRQASQRAQDFGQRADNLSFADDLYLDHETWIRPGMAQLGDVAGLHVLDLGCGHGMAAVVLARHGAQVTALDLSFGYLDEARRRAAANGAAISFVQADGERLPFADSSFDRIWGNAVLHHLDLTKTVPELRRILSRGGKAVFCEPWGENPLLNWVRTSLPYPGKQRTADEQPLFSKDLRVLRAGFPRMAVRGYQLLSMARRAFRCGPLIAGLDWCDDLLLSRVPALQRFCRYVVLTLSG